MIKETLQSQLASADPVAEGADDSARALVRRMSAEARAAYVVRSRERAPWWKRPRTVLPVGLVGLAALTGAAVLVPLGLSINGTQVDPDVEIPIVYTTDTGTHVSCRYGITSVTPRTGAWLTNGWRSSLRLMTGPELASASTTKQQPTLMSRDPMTTGKSTTRRSATASRSTAPWS